ncbi:MAG: T9SS type A sorting domain-containing protein [Candidatus Marinimicrobia bacterium]|nr:T9SS type A sorting domain-containing protein [Candidatus Neomarinimicrobiota bacterium]
MLFTTSSIFAANTFTVTGGNVVVNYWNESNTGATANVTAQADPVNYVAVYISVDGGTYKAVTGGDGSIGVGGSRSFSLTAANIEAADAPLSDGETFHMYAVFSNFGAPVDTIALTSTALTVDQSDPAEADVGTVVAVGGNVVTSKWNSSNTALQAAVPIANDGTLLGGTIQLLGKIGSNPYANLGAAEDIDAINVTEQIQVSAANVEALLGFEEGRSIYVKAEITDVAGNESIGSESGSVIAIDQTTPTITSITSSPISTTLGTGDNITITVTFSEDITLSSGTLDMELETGGSDATVSVAAASLDHAGTASFTYAVSANEISSDLNVNQLTLSGANNLRDAAGNDASLAVPGSSNLADNSNIIVDGVSPTIVSVTSTSANGIYALGESINVTVTFSEAVTLSGGQSLQVTLETGTTDRTVSISSISNSTTAAGTYTVQSDDESSLLVAKSPLTLTGGTLQDVAGNDLVLTFTTNIDNASSIEVDGGIPAAVNLAGGAGTVVATGGTVMAGYWNSDNTSLNVTIPIADDASLLNGSVQLKGYWGVAGGAQNLGSASTISATGVNKLIQIASGTLEGFGGFAENEVLKIVAIVTDEAGNTSTVGTKSDDDITIDQTAPTITNITSTTNNGAVIPTNPVNVTLTYSEAVTLAGGTLEVEFETGTTDRTASIATITSSTTASGTYTVQVGDAAADLDVNRVYLSAGTLLDAAGNDASMTIPTGSNLANNKNIQVDGIIPTVTSVTSTSPNGDYSIGESVTVVVAFSENVTLAGGGSLQIEMETGATDRNVSISTISGTNQASGTYIVQSGDVSTDLDANSPLTLTGGTLRDAAGNDVNLTFSNGIASGSDIVVDGVVPSTVDLAGGAGTVVATGGTVKAGYWNNTNTFLQVVVPIAADPSLIDGTVQIRGYWGTVGGAQNLGDPATISSTGVNKTILIPAATLEAFAGFAEDAVLKIIAVVTDKAGNQSSVGTKSNDEITIDQTAPTIASLTSTSANGYKIPGASVNVTVTFSEAVTLAGGNLEIELETGTTDQTVVISTINSSLTGSGNYIVQTNDETDDLTVKSLSLSAGTLRDAAGNATTLTIPEGVNLADNNDIVVDGIIPSITGISSDTNDDNPIPVGGTVNVIVTFSEEVTLSGGGNLQITLETGTTDRIVSISTINNSTTANGTYTVQSGDQSSDLSATSPLTLTSGNLKDAAGNAVVLTFTGNINDASDLIIDGVVPTAVNLAGGAGTVVAVGGTVVSGYWNNTNTTLNVTIPIAADPSLVGGTVQLKGYWGVVGGAQNLGTASTITSSGTNKTIQVSSATLEAFAGFDENAVLKIVAVVTDKAGNTSTVGTESDNEITIDQTSPTISTLTSTTNGYVIPGNTVDILVTFSEVVTLAAGNLLVTLETGTTDRIVTISTINASLTATNDYTVQTGDASSDLTVNSVSLSTGSLRDNAGNNAVLSLPDGENLADNNAIVVDGVIPTIVSITSTEGEIYYKLGDEVPVNVTFSEPVTLAGGGSLQIEMETGATDRTVSITSINNSQSAAGIYTVQENDASSDLRANAPLVLSGATLKDQAGNNVDLSSIPININQDSDAIIDGIIPAAVNLASGAGTVVATGGTVKAGYWNSGNTALSVVIPIAADASLLGGQVQLKGYWGVVGGAQNLGDPSNITATGANKTISIPRATLEAFAGYAEQQVLKIIAIVTDKAGNESPVGSDSDNEITIDETVATIASITSTTPDGYAIPADEVNITVNFTEAVTLAGGSLNIKLETGASDQTISVASVTSSLTAVGTYTVLVNHLNTDLSVISITLSAGTLRDAAGNTTTLSLPVGSNLNNNSNIYVDGVLPTVTAITSTSDDSDQYGKDGTINLTVEFSEAVSLSSSETLDLNIDASTTDVQITSFSNSTSASANYVVQEGDASTDLSVNAMSLSGGTLTDLAGNSVDLSDISGITNLDDAYAFVIDGILPPAFNMVSVVPTSGNIVAGYWNNLNDGLNVTVAIPDDASLQNGTLQIRGRVASNSYVNLGAASTILASNSNKTVLVDDSVVEAMTGFANGETFTIAAVITDAAGNTKSSTVLSNIGIDIDQIAPTITEISSSTNDGSYSVGESVNVTVSLSELVTLLSGQMSVTLNTAATPHVLTDNAIVNEQELSFAYIVEEDEVANPLTVTTVAATSNQLRDVAGNEVNFTLPVGNNLADNSTIVIDGEYPSIIGISAVVVNDTLGLGETIDVEIEFNEALTLAGGTLDVVFETGTVDRTVSIASFTNSSTAIATYTVATGDNSSDLNVSSITLSAGTIQDIAGNALTPSLPSGQNLADNNQIIVDGIVPVAFTTGDILTIGAPVVTGYWNIGNTDVEVILPVTGSDQSLNGGSASLEARMNSNSFEAVGTSEDVGTNPVTLSLSRLQIEGISGYAAGGTIQIRGILTDIAGNSTIGTTSNVSLIKDQTAPTVPVTGTLTVQGGNSYAGYWNDTNTNLIVNIPLGNDNTLINGSIQLEADLNGANSFTNIGNDSTISTVNATHQINLTAADITSYGAGDGDVMTIRAVVTDIAGNATTGTIGLNSMTLDYTFPSAFTVGTVIATANSVVAGYFNTTNTGAAVTIPIPADATLVGGHIQLRAIVDAFGAEDILVPYTVLNSDLSDDVILSVSRSDMEGLTNYAEDRTITFDAILTDAAGNATLGSSSLDELKIDQILPGAFSISSNIPDGGTIREGYWNSTNTGVIITVPIDGTDLSIIGGGTLAASGDILGDGNFETFSVEETIFAATGTLSILVPAAELEALEGGTAFLNGQDIEFRAIITDEAGNRTTSPISTQLLEIDRGAPNAPSITAFTIEGENIAPLRWNATADSLLLTMPVNTVADPTLVGGFFQVQMSIGTTFAENGYYAVLPDSFLIPTADDTIRISAADLEALPDFADLNLYTRILIQDRAGNETIGSPSGSVILIDTNGPADFTCGPLIATGGVTVANAYNNTNTGISLSVPIANDPSLLNGRAIIRTATRNLNVFPPDLIIPSFVDTVSISQINTTLNMTLDLATLVDLGGFISNYELFATADLLDVAGNQVEGTQSPNELTIDFDGPLPPVVTDTTTVGGNIVQGYWNTSNTGLDLTISTPVDVDTSLFHGYIQIEGRIGADPAGTLIDSLPIISANNTSIVASITAEDLEGLSISSEGQILSLRIKMVDSRGNDTLSAWMGNILIMDQIAPSLSAFNPDGTTTDDYITFDDTLKADWQDFTDDVSDVAYYDFSIGHAAGTDDFLAWDTLLTTSVDTLMTYTHADEYYLNVRAMDFAGNLSDILSSPVITADLNLPQTTSAMDDFYFIEFWPDALSGTYADDLSGIDSIWLSLERDSDGLFWGGDRWTGSDTLLEATLDVSDWSFALSSDSLTNREDYILRIFGLDIAGNRNSTLTATTDIFQFVINTAPEFVDDSTYTDSSDEDSQYSRFFLVDDPDVGSISADTLYWSLSADAPAGVAIDSLTGELTWLPVDSAVGDHTFMAYVHDYYDEIDSIEISHRVIEVNDAPEPVTLLLPADSTQLTPSDSLLLTFTWTTAFDIEENPVSYLITMQGTDYDTTLATADTSITVDVSVMDYPSSTIEWFVRALDQADTSAIADTFHVTTSSAFASLNTDSIAIDIERLTDIDTSFTMGNLGLTDLRWSLLDAPAWISLATEAGTIEYDTSAVIAFNVNPSAFTTGGYGGQFQILTNDPLHDTITVKVSMDIFDVPTPVIAFYKNMAYPAYYEMMIVDSLGMIDSLVITHAGLELEYTAVDTFSYISMVEVAEEGLNSFEVYASNWVGDTTITVNVTVSLIKRGAGWLARSPDDQFEMKGGSHSAARTSRIAILDSVLSANDEARYKVLSDGGILAEPVLVSMPSLANDQAIYTQDISGNYFELASVSDGERVSAWTATMGAFKLGPRTIIVPENSRLAQNYPNPFNPTTTIDFDIGFLDGLNQEVEFSIYNIRGQEVRTLMNTQMQPGSYSMMWNGLDDQGKQVSSGIYFARLMTGKGYAKTVKMLVLR